MHFLNSTITGREKITPTQNPGKLLKVNIIIECDYLISPEYGSAITSERCVNKSTYTNVCNGTIDCFAKGKHLCDRVSNCFGVMWNNISGSRNGFMLCTATGMEPNTGNGWITIRKVEGTRGL